MKNISEKRSSLWSSEPQGFKIIAMRSPKEQLSDKKRHFYFSIRIQPTEQLINKIVLNTPCWFLLLCKKCIIDSSHSIWKTYARKQKLPSSVPLRLRMGLKLSTFFIHHIMKKNFSLLQETVNLTIKHVLTL